MENNTKYLRDLAKVASILESENITAVQRRELLSIYSVAYHDSGKIEGIASLDGTATHCSFCKAMQAAAEMDKTIVCGGCYALAMESYRTNVTNRNYIRQLIMSKVEFTVDELSTLNIPSRFVRFNSDGDLENTTQAINYLRIAKAHSWTKAALWTKNLPALKTAIEKEGKPENMIIIYSSCRLNESRVDLFEKYPWIDYVFTVYVDKKSTAAAIENGANECNGKKCMDCGFKCYNGTWKKHTNIAEYLRGVNPQKRAELLKAVQARKA